MRLYFMTTQKTSRAGSEKRPRGRDAPGARQAGRSQAGSRDRSGRTGRGLGEDAGQGALDVLVDPVLAGGEGRADGVLHRAGVAAAVADDGDALDPQQWGPAVLGVVQLRLNRRSAGRARMPPSLVYQLSMKAAVRPEMSPSARASEDLRMALPTKPSQAITSNLPFQMSRPRRCPGSSGPRHAGPGRPPWWWPSPCRPLRRR